MVQDVKTETVRGLRDLKSQVPEVKSMSTNKISNIEKKLFKMNIKSSLPLLRLNEMKIHRYKNWNSTRGCDRKLLN
ncbi:MAG: hypothetical protein JWR87_341 [Segetibacter sp.]|nr:hypothetical protein [Segetibacter sp.]